MNDLHGNKIRKRPARKTTRNAAPPPSPPPGFETGARAPEYEPDDGRKPVVVLLGHLDDWKMLAEWETRLALVIFPSCYLQREHALRWCHERAAPHEDAESRSAAPLRLLELRQGGYHAVALSACRDSDILARLGVEVR